MINATVKQNIQDRIEARAAKKRKLTAKEAAGKIRGNGYHARQKIAAFAAHEIEDRWIDL